MAPSQLNKKRCQSFVSNVEMHSSDLKQSDIDCSMKGSEEKIDMVPVIKNNGQDMMSVSPSKRDDKGEFITQRPLKTKPPVNS